MDKFNLLKVFRQSIIIYLQNDSRARKLSFTMAEILLSLTIIGVVAAITLPSLTGNINERTWNTQRKALYARMSQAIALMGSLNGYGIGATESETASNAAKAFITNGLAKVYKINNICDYEHLGDCGIPDKITKYNTQSKINIPKNLTTLNYLFYISNYTLGAISSANYSQINTYIAAFETVNGENIVTYYNPFCSNQYQTVSRIASSGYEYKVIQPTMCVNFIYDLNGKKGPNAIGKDVGFMTVFYPTDSIVTSVVPIDTVATSQWTTYNPESLCRAKKGEDARAANLEELKSLFINYNLISNGAIGDSIVSKTKYSTNYYYALTFYLGSLWTVELTNIARPVYCVK